MDGFLKDWKQQNLGTEDEIKKYLRKQNTIDRKITQGLQSAGVERAVGEADRRTYLRLTQEKGFRTMCFCMRQNTVP